MKAQAFLPLFALTGLLTISGSASALATAGVFSTYGMVNDSDSGPLTASAAGAYANRYLEGSVFAAADLSRGVLRLAVDASPGEPFTGNAASAFASFADTITIVGPSASSVPVSFFLDVNARLTGDAPDDGTFRLDFSAELDVSGNLAPNGPSFSIVRFRNPDEDVIQCAGSCNALNAPLTTAGHVDATLAYTQNLVPNRPYDIDAVMRATVLGARDSQLHVDAGHTARLSAVLPAGYSFSSASGGFLTAVPIPAAGWLFASALGGLAALRRARRH